MPIMRPVESLSTAIICMSMSSATSLLSSSLVKHSTHRILYDRLIDFDELLFIYRI